MSLKAESISVWLSILDKVKKSGDGYVSVCPSHKDNNPSFIFKEDDKSAFGISFKCLAGCDSTVTIEVLLELGLLISDGKFCKIKKQMEHVPPEFNGMKLSSVHTYKDFDGLVLFYVGRYESKSGKQTIPFAIKPKEDWMWWKAGLGEYKNGNRPLYNLNLIAKSNEIFFVEGEKCADKLRSVGVVATTCVGGSCAISMTNLMPLKGRVIYIWRDKDDPGAKWEHELKRRLKDMNITYKVVDTSKIQG